MRSLVRAELRKLRSVRSVTGVVAAVVAFAFLAFAPVWTLDDAAKAEWTADALLPAVRGPAFVVALAMLIVGVLATAGELRHGTMASTLLVAPRRGRVAVAKLVAVVAVAAAPALAVNAVTLALGTVTLRSAGVAVSPFTGDALGTAGVVVLVAMAYGAVGVGLGLLARDQTAVLVGALVWTTVVENIVPIVLRAPGTAKWMPGGAVRSLLSVATPDPSLAAPAAAAVVLATVAALLVAGGTAAFARRDVQ